MYEYRVRVPAGAYDGDTIRLDIDLGFGVWINNQPFRLAGIDAFELGDPGGIEARDYLRKLAPPHADLLVVTQKDSKEKYGRYLAYLYDPFDTITSINQKLIDAGHAVPYSGGKR